MSGAFGTLGGCRGHLGQMVAIATPFPTGHHPGPCCRLAFHSSFLSGKITISDVVRSDPNAWVNLLRKCGTVCGHSGLGDAADLGTPTDQHLFLQCGRWLWV